ncbi:MAG: cyclic nucleotide-binding domain-containing protein, partial [Nitrospinae bacterium]|nr:cyclic nucleotide-binding domain-containing protein [Nitrospinota bacterium]
QKTLSLKPDLGDILVEMGTLSQETLEEKLKEYKSFVQQFESIKKTLAQLTMFKSLDENSIDYLSYIPEKVKANAGQHIIQQGDESDYFYSVIKGALKVTINNSEGEEGTYITSINSDDIFGEAAIFGIDRRNANIIATEESELLRFNKDDFITFLQKYPKSSQPVLVHILRRLLFKLNAVNKKAASHQRQVVGQDEINRAIDHFFKQKDKMV